MALNRSPNCHRASILLFFGLCVIRRNKPSRSYERSLRNRSMTTSQRLYGPTHRWFPFSEATANELLSLCKAQFWLIFLEFLLGHQQQQALVIIIIAIHLQSVVLRMRSYLLKKKTKTFSFFLLRTKIHHQTFTSLISRFSLCVECMLSLSLSRWISFAENDAVRWKNTTEKMVKIATTIADRKRWNMNKSCHGRWATPSAQLANINAVPSSRRMEFPRS